MYKDKSLQVNFTCNNLPRSEPTNLLTFKPYHQRLFEYYKARSRIFGDNIMQIAEPTNNRKIKRSTLRYRTFWNQVKANRIKLVSSIESLNKPMFDVRPYVNVKLFGKMYSGLVDSGATITCLGSETASELLNKEIKFKRLNELVQTASGSKYRIEGYMDTDISLGNHKEKIRVYIIPDLKQTLYLGVDFIRKFGLMDKILSSFSFASNDDLLDNEPGMHILNLEQSHRLKMAIEMFPSFEKCGLGRTKVIRHTIELQPNTKPVKQRYFSVSPAVERKLHAEVDRMLSLDVIEPAPPNCSWSSPVALIKREGKTRLCLDSRKLNSVTVRDAYPLPKINGILSRLPRAEYISSLDLKHAFWQVELDEPSRDLTAFTVPNRPLYRFKVMPFGLTNAPMTMSRLMDAIIPSELQSQVFIYLDDLLLVSESFDGHIELLVRVANILRDAGLTVNIAKCRLCMREVRYLGFVIGDGVMKPDPEKVRAIRDIRPPRTVRELRRFLGLAGWYRRFVEGFADISSPLTDLTSKTKKFEWNPEAQKSFEILKEKLTSAPVLITPNFSKPFVIQCDASTYGVGGVLAQEDEEGIERPIAYFSHKLNRAQRNYSITELECLAAILSIQKFREYVEGHPFKVITDHASLQWLMRQNDLNGRLARWSLKLQGFDFSIQHRKGSLNTVPDTLSRLGFEELESLEVSPDRS